MRRTMWYGDGPHAARISPEEALALAGFPATDTVELTLGWTIERPSWLTDPSRRGRTVLAGYGLAGAVNDGRFSAIRIRLSEIAGMIEAEPPEIAVVAAVQRGSDLAFTGSVGWVDVLARTAARVVVEVDPDGVDLGAPLVEGNIVAVVPRPAASGAPPAASRPADETDLHIGALVASLLPDDATVQFGPGGIGEGIARGITKPVHIWSGLVTDTTALLHERGLLLGSAVTTYAWGSDKLRALANDGRLSLRSTTYTHDPARLAAIPRFVTCNTALQIDHEGNVNVEKVNGRTIAAIGGHPDFCIASSSSADGLSIIALRSTTANGSPTIVPGVDIISTPGLYVDVLVTEHGITHLHGLNDKERRYRLSHLAPVTGN